MIRLEKQTAEPSARHKSNPTNVKNRSQVASRRGLTPTRSEADKHLTTVKRHHSPRMSAGLNSGAAQQIDREEAGPAVSMATDDRQMSYSGIVDAILHVSRQRKSLLDQLRAALLSGDDSEALGFARHLCGLAA